MKLELGTLIIDKTEGINDIGVVVEVEENDWGDRRYQIYWVCRRTHGIGNYTATLDYTQEELELEEFELFEVIEKRT